MSDKGSEAVAPERVVAPAADAPRTPAAWTTEELDAKHAAWLAERRRRAEDLVRQSRRSWAALEGWGSAESEEQWRDIQNRAMEDWLSGATLLELCGGERYLDPPRMALLLNLWDHFVRTYRPEGPAEYLCIALALVSFNHFTRLTEVVGNLANRLEHTFFGTDPLEVRVIQASDKVAPADRLQARSAAHDHVQALGRELLPTLDRLNRMVLRNLQALRDLKATPLSMTVQNYGQLNVAHQQANLAQPAAPAVGTRPDGAASRRGLPERMGQEDEP